VANLCQSIFTIEFLEDKKRRQIGVELVSFPDLFFATRETVCNIMFLCQHVGMAPEEGVYLRDKMSDPAYKPPLHFRLALRLQNGGHICGTLRYLPTHSAAVETAGTSGIVRPGSNVSTLRGECTEMLIHPVVKLLLSFEKIINLIQYLLGGTVF